MPQAVAAAGAEAALLSIANFCVIHILAHTHTQIQSEIAATFCTAALLGQSEKLIDRPFLLAVYLTDCLSEERPTLRLFDWAD